MEIRCHGVGLISSSKAVQSADLARGGNGGPLQQAIGQRKWFLKFCMSWSIQQIEGFKFVGGMWRCKLGVRHSRSHFHERTAT